MLEKKSEEKNEGTGEVSLLDLFLVIAENLLSGNSRFPSQYRQAKPL